MHTQTVKSVTQKGFVLKMKPILSQGYGYTRGKNDPATPRCFLPRTPTLMILSIDPGPSDYQAGEPGLMYSTFHVS